MGYATDTKMINGRVNRQSAAKASRILHDRGLTTSAFIRNCVDYVAREGIVPECGFRAANKIPELNRLRAFVKEIEARPMPGKLDFAGLSEDELTERLLMERYGY